MLYEVIPYSFSCSEEVTERMLKECDKGNLEQKNEKGEKDWGVGDRTC